MTETFEYTAPGLTLPENLIPNTSRAEALLGTIRASLETHRGIAEVKFVANIQALPADAELVCEEILMSEFDKYLQDADIFSEKAVLYLLIENKEGEILIDIYFTEPEEDPVEPVLLEPEPRRASFLCAVPTGGYRGRR